MAGNMYADESRKTLQSYGYSHAEVDRCMTTIRKGINDTEATASVAKQGNYSSYGMKALLTRMLQVSPKGKAYISLTGSTSLFLISY